jgi:hypothetical protein
VQYGKQFGWRVSDESKRSSMGRVKSPTIGTPIIMGQVVELDPVSPGYLKVGGSGVKPLTGYCGLFLQDEQMFPDIWSSYWQDSYSIAVGKLNKLSVIANGAGSHVWYKNISGPTTRADGRVLPDFTMFDSTDLDIGHGFGWDGSKFVNVTDPTDSASFGTVVYLDPVAEYVEVMLTH